MPPTYYDRVTDYDLETLQKARDLVRNFVPMHDLVSTNNTETADSLDRLTDKLDTPRFRV